MEVERKFVLERAPASLAGGEGGVLIRQGYISVETGEIRLRSMGSDLWLTVKSDGDLERQEWEVPIPAWTFELLWGSTSGGRLEKNRYRLAWAGRKLELDEYLGRLSGLVVLECEFETKEEAQRFVLPDWCRGAREVTHDGRYKNKALARAAAPPSD